MATGSRRPTNATLTWMLIAAVAVQFGVPTVALLQEKPARFGFQMYSGYGGGAILVLDETGNELDVDSSALLPRPLRPELDWTQHVPEYFCRAIPIAATVVIERDSGERAIVPCD